jgi:diguanylate cyclase (GGDEF)-like protein
MTKTCSVDHMPNSIPSTNLRRTRLTAALALFLIVLLGALLMQGMVDVQASVKGLRNNDLASIEIHSVLIDLIDAETGQRGFLLTGDERYLEPYQRGRNHIQVLIRSQQRFGYMREQLGADGEEIMRLAQGKLEELGRTIALRRANDVAAALQVVQKGYGKAVMDQNRQLIERNLNRLRHERDIIMDDLQVRFWRAAMLLVGMLLTISALAAYTWQRLSRAVKANNALAKRLSQEATHDALTGMPNRRFFDKWADHLIKKNIRDYQPFTLMLIDLDGFKKVNDTLGHGAGDEVLKQAAVRLQNTLRGNELLARLGGDEFGLLIEGTLSHIELTSLGDRLIASLIPSLYDGLPDRAVGASIGVAQAPENGADIASLKAAADAALYESKDRGRGRISFAPRRLVETGNGDEMLRARLL